MAATAPTGSASDAQFVANQLAVGAHFALDQGLNNVVEARTIRAATDATAASDAAANHLTDSDAATAALPDRSELVVKLLGISDLLPVS